MNPIHFACVLASASLLPAQSSVAFSALTKTPVAVRAVVGTQVGFQGVAANTALSTGNLLPPLSVANAGASASIGTVAVASATSGVTLVWDASVSGTSADAVGHSASPSANGASFGAQSYLVRIQPGSAGANGFLRVSWQTVVGSTASARAWVDVGDNGVDEWSGVPTLGNAMETKYVPVSVPASGLTVRLSIEGKATGTGVSGTPSRSYGALRVAFQDGNAGKATLSAYGTDCGPLLSGGVVTAAGQHVVTFVLGNGFASSYALHAIGSQSLNLDLGNGCKLLSNALVVNLVPTDALGSAVDVLRVPVTTAGTTYHQFLPLGLVGGNLVIAATGGQKLVSTGL